MNIRWKHVFAAVPLVLVPFVVGCKTDDKAATSVPATSQPAASQPTARPTTAAGQPTALTTVSNQSKVMSWDKEPAMAINPNKKYTATIQLAKSDAAKIVIELYAKEAPHTVNSFVFLSRQGYYDGVTFHRVLADFMAQGGDPTGTGSGGPGYSFVNEFSPIRRHDSAGTLSMANAGLRNGQATNGSQFFITFVPTSNLDGLNPEGSPKNCGASGVSCHTVFGKVISGMDVLMAIKLRDPGSARTPGDAIKTITIKEE